MKLKEIKNLLGVKKPKAAKTKVKVLTAEGWKRRFSQKTIKSKKITKR